MRRREFLGALGATAAWPLDARAERADKVYRIGYLGLASAAAQATRMKALREGLGALGYIEGKNIAIEERRLEGSYDPVQLAELAAQVVDLKPDVIVTHGPAVLAAKRATTTIPIVIAQTGDAVATGLVASLARPGGNVTGMTFFGPELAVKRLELLKEAVPDLAQVGALTDPENPISKLYLAAMKLAAQSLKLELSEFAVRVPSDLAGAFAAMTAKPVGAFVRIEEPVPIYNAEAIAQLAMKYRLAACGFVEFAQAGGFMGYGVNFPEMWRHAATFVGKILKGAKPADLPVEQPTKFVTIVNLKTARAIGMETPTSLLLRADEVTE
ncbi:MAG TPA: ABC transporter substrate-binding protein [Steroidobacteraceae bacterium]|nr:ABC transporter substrate-binding protein [Steroidobacteraceae bacterium]